MMRGVFSQYPDIERPQYADKNAEDKLEAMLEELLSNKKAHA
jgi:hypothetical protein